MSSTVKTNVARVLVVAVMGAAPLAMTTTGCDKKDDSKSSSGTAPSSSAAKDPVSSTTIAASASATPAASASALVPRSDCPKGSSGPGTFDKPCEAKGTVRMMEAIWNGKTDDKGPFFKVTNKSPSVVLYGKIDVYFYDKAGKQLEVKDSNGKARPYQGCGGNIFSGVMKPNEKATIQFSCVKKENVPEGTAAIEAELQQVGFADSTEKKNEFYWKNDDLVPDARKKGGVK